MTYAGKEAGVQSVNPRLRVGWPPSPRGRHLGERFVQIPFHRAGHGRRQVARSSLAHHRMAWCSAGASVTAPPRGRAQ